MAMIKGGCLCGAVRYEITGALGVTGHCHCSTCRRSHGAAFATWATVEPVQFRWTSGADEITEFDSSPGLKRCFCRRCGSPLAITESDGVHGIVLGTVDGDPGVRPLAHMFVGSKAPWHEIADDLPQFDEWPPGMEP